MLNEREINLLPERIAERLRRSNTEYLENIGRVINKIGELRPTDVHQLQQMYNYGADLQKVTSKLAEVNKKNIQDIYDMFDIVAMENYNYAKPFYDAKAIPHIPYAQNEDLKQYVKSLAKQTVDEYINLTQHTAFAIFDKDGKSIAPLFANNKDKIATSLSDTYSKVIDYAVSNVQLGKESYQTAMRKVVKSLANSGIKTVEYATGYKRKLDSAVRQNILWGVKQCNQNVADYVGEQFGADGYEISYHLNPRPEHADMGGKSYAIGKARTINGIYYPSFSEVEKLLDDYGCLHFKYPILLGISRPAYDKGQLEELKANDSAKFEFEGKEYTKYDGERLQKQIESAVKNKKDLANIAKASGDEDLRREVQYEINLLTSKYAKLSEVSGLPTRMERMQVAGFKRVKTIDKSFKSGIIKDKNGEDMLLPNAISASTAQNKLQGYLLNSNHPVGKHKARVINSVLGFHYENWDELSNILFDAVQNAPVSNVTKTKHGVKYTVPIRVTGKKGKSMILTTVWQIDNGSNIPRFITSTFNKKSIR